MTESSNRGSTVATDRFNRRDVLRTVGAGAAAGAGLVAASGSASAHSFDEVVFCGCSQVCVCGTGTVHVVVAHETDTGFDCRLVERQSVDEPFSLCHEVSEGKVVAIITGLNESNEEVVCNPHEPCAGDALADCGISCGRDGQSGGPCGEAFLRTCGEADDRPGRGP